MGTSGIQLLGCALDGRTHFGVALRQIPDDDILGVFLWIAILFVNNVWSVLFFYHQLKCCASGLGFWEFLHPCCSPICFGAPGLLSSSGLMEDFHTTCAKLGFGTVLRKEGTGFVPPTVGEAAGGSSCGSSSVGWGKHGSTAC